MMCSAQWNVDLCDLFVGSLQGIFKTWNIVLWSNAKTFPKIISTRKSFIIQVNRFSNQNVLLISYEWHYPSHTPWFDNPFIIWWHVAGNPLQPYPTSAAPSALASSTNIMNEGRNGKKCSEETATIGISEWVACCPSFSKKVARSSRRREMFLRLVSARNFHMPVPIFLSKMISLLLGHFPSPLSMLQQFKERS